MVRQNPQPGPINAAIQQLGDQQIHHAAQGFGLSLSEPADSFEERIDTDGVINRRNASNNAWQFNGIAGQPWNGVPYLDASYVGLSMQCYNTTHIEISPGSGACIWPLDNPQLKSKNIRVELPRSTRKRLDPSAAWSSGTNGNLNHLPITNLPGDTVFYVYLIRKEADNTVDFVALRGLPKSTNDQLVIGGQPWRIAFPIGQVLYNDSSGLLPFQQVGRETRVLGDKTYVFSNLNAVNSSINLTNLPRALVDMGVNLPSAIDDSIVALRMDYEVLGINFSDSAAIAINPTSHPINTRGVRIFGPFISMVTTKPLSGDVIFHLAGWTDSALPKVSR